MLPSLPLPFPTLPSFYPPFLPPSVLPSFPLFFPPFLPPTFLLPSLPSFLLSLLPSTPPSLPPSHYLSLFPPLLHPPPKLLFRGFEEPQSLFQGGSQRLQDTEAADLPATFSRGWGWERCPGGPSQVLCQPQRPPSSRARKSRAPNPPQTKPSNSQGSYGNPRFIFSPSLTLT